MFVAPHPPRGSFNIPVNINLQGARRRQTRATFYQSQLNEAQRRQVRDGCCAGDRPKPQVLLSSVGDERAVLLGFAMMAFSILMLFVVGFAAVKPHLQSVWSEETNCSVIVAKIREEWADCRGLSKFPCVQVFVNISNSGKRARLHHDERSLDMNSECFYTPKCHRSEADLLSEAQNITVLLRGQQSETLRCHTNAKLFPDDAILDRKFTRTMALWYLLWPSLMLGGGLWLVGLVKLNQQLAHLCAELDSQEAQAAFLNERLHQLLSWRPTGSGSSPQETSD